MNLQLYATAKSYTFIIKYFDVSLQMDLIKPKINVVLCHFIPFIQYISLFMEIQHLKVRTVLTL